MSKAWGVVTLRAILVISFIKLILFQFMLDVTDKIDEDNEIYIMNKKNIIDKLFKKNLGSGNTYSINGVPYSIQKIIREIIQISLNASKCSID